jgi:hypothetical protein
MGPLEKPDVNLRAWGSDTFNIAGIVNAVIENSKGTQINSKIYVVDGFGFQPVAQNFLMNRVFCFFCLFHSFLL